MYYNLHCVISLCILSLGAAHEACSKGVLNKRAHFPLVTGQTLSLSCVVQHCGHSFNGTWIWKNSTDNPFSSVQTTDHHRLTREDLSRNQTRLLLELLRVREMDKGYYGCRVMWSLKQMDQGHFMFVNVTAAVPFDRPILHRFLVCAGPILCVFIILGLGICLKSKVTREAPHRKLTPVTSPRPKPRPSVEYQAPLQQSTPQPPPRQHAPQKLNMSSKKAPHQPQQKTEVVYADISPDALLRQQQRVQQSQQSTVYSSVRFA